jgi:hypothetical protein
MYYVIIANLKRKQNVKRLACYKCRKLGPFSKNCRIKNNIIELNLNEELKI